MSCPRCAGPVREPDLMHAENRCLRCGPVAPLPPAGRPGRRLTALSGW
ncbi:DUF6758 family protein [Micromonospora chalcea]